MKTQQQLYSDPVVRRTAAERDSAWDDFVANCPGGDLVQTTAWAATKRAVGLHTSLTTLHGPGDEILGGGLIIAKRVLAGIRVGYVAYGPLVGDVAATERCVDELIASARSLDVRLLIVQAPMGSDAVDLAFAKYGFEHGCPAVAPEATIRLSLRATEDEILAGMRKSRRRRIRKALQSSIVVEQDEDVALFQHLHAATAARRGFTAIDVAVLRAQWRVLAPAGFCTMFIARQEGKAVAGTWLTSFSGVVTSKISGWDATARNADNANEALRWAAIRWARAAGAKTFDFSGFDRRTAELIAANETLPEEIKQTPHFFKLGFGGSPVLLPRARWSVIGMGRRLMKAPARWALSSRQVRSIANRLRSG